MKNQKYEKKQISSKKGSIARKISMMIMLLIMCSVVLSNILAIHISRNDLENLQNNLLEENVVTNTRAFSEYFDSQLKTVKDITDVIDISRTFDVTDDYEHLKKISKDHNYLNVYYVRKNADMIVFGEEINITIAKNVKFFEPSFNGETFVTEPYIDGVTGENCVSISAPVYNEQSEIVGAFGVDIRTDDISKYLSNAIELIF